MKPDQVNELIYQVLGRERGGMFLNEELKEEWAKYLEQTQNHERVVLRVIEELPRAEDAGPSRRPPHRGNPS